jgi:hypothetical protein
MDMPRSLAAYRDVSHQYMLMPDHVPQIDGRDPSGIVFAYRYGYIKPCSTRWRRSRVARRAAEGSASHPLCSRKAAWFCGRAHLAAA